MSNRKRKVRIVVATACATIALVAFHLLTWGLTVEAGVGFNYVLPDDYDFNRPDPPPEINGIIDAGSFNRRVGISD